MTGLRQLGGQWSVVTAADRQRGTCSSRMRFLVERTEHGGYTTLQGLNADRGDDGEHQREKGGGKGQHKHPSFGPSDARPA